MVISKNIYVTLFTVLSALFLTKFLNDSKPKHPDAGLNIEQLIQKYKYPIETHEVTTDDGYILTLHRIPQGQNKSTQNRIPILLMHGFSQSATNFVNLGPRKALSFLLADKGYDIWLGNARGTTWSRKHKSLDPNKDYGFWDYSMHEIGFYDVPAFIDHVLQVTGQNIFNISEFLSNDGLIAAYLKQICDENSIFVNLCLHHNFLLQGYNPEGTNKTLLSLIFSNTPAGVSIKQFMHIIQLMDSGNRSKNS
ncbi:Abhydro lipase domain containing protein, partial [Asbolus verrucosus]